MRTSSSSKDHRQPKLPLTPLGEAVAVFGFLVVWAIVFNHIVGFW